MFASEIFLAALTQSLVGVSMGARGRGGGGGAEGGSIPEGCTFGRLRLMRLHAWEGTERVTSWCMLCW